MSLLPKMAKIRIIYNAPEISNLSSYLINQLKEARLSLKPNAKIGIAVGSRGIAGLPTIISTVADFLYSQGARPVIIPAMGSHGGATAQGQIDLLASYGITESSVKAPIVSNMDTVLLGRLDGDIPVYFDRTAASLDGIILVNRVKPHTDFHADYESGLAKQLVIGLGNHRGAQLVHSYGLYGLQKLIPEMAGFILKSLPILLGVAVLENANDKTAEIHVLTGEKILSREPELLAKARALMPKLPVNDVDLLVVQEMGKNISGVGIDPNITGRTGIRYSDDEDYIQIRRIVCLDLTPESHGNALGMGLVDVIPRRLEQKIDFDTTYANVITSTFLERGFMPVVQPHDRAAMEIALRCSGRKISPINARVLQIKNTLELNEMFVSLPLLDQINEECNWEKLEEFQYRFSPEGTLLNLLG